MVYTQMHLQESPDALNECKSTDERLRFIARLLEREKMARPCQGVRHHAIDPNHTELVHRLVDAEGLALP